MSRDQDPLSHEERALADALAGATPRRGPSPRVDAAILASARTAAKNALPPARRSLRRWPAMLGVAASLVVAVGIAWQLRPVPEQALPVSGEAALRSPPAPVASYQAPAADRPAGDVPEGTGVDVASSPAETAIGRSRVRQPADAPPTLARTLGKSNTVAPPPIAPPETEAGDDGGIVFERQDLHEDPPATVDSPGIHRAWLDRIRELRAAGEIEAARESLREYHRRHPGQPLPDDLDGLLEE